MAQENIKIDIQEIHTTNGAKITAIGVGGGGSNMIAHLIATGAHKDITLIAANTDVQHLDKSPARIKITLGEKLTKGLGAGMQPEVGMQAAQESFEDIKEALEGSDIVFVSVGLGGGTGTGAAPIIAAAAKEIGALTISIVTKPFKFEGNKRTKIAEEGLKELKKNSDAIVVIPNEKLLSTISKNTGIKESFREVDNILAQAVNGISGVILNYGENDINLDFADLKTVMSHKGLALMGIGEAKGENAAAEAIKDAINSPLFDNLSINGAMGVLVNFEVNTNYPTTEINAAMQFVEEAAHQDADIIFGTQTSEDTALDSVRVTIVATGFEKEIINDAQANIESHARPMPKISLEAIRVSNGDYYNEVDLDMPTMMRNQKD
ncbi:cell division protein FtsZ [Helicobacter cappadocius]|uniref:Cell division protein FtsZ n=1 Tax=Helicobacter cappadocius TaxID=3063998 RepID=A0AA90SSD9_9HELI|nr:MULTISPECIES: cell division protein FtsZ [unclassified Helicobacter]MDO7253100.1 cell division protein FtsZ [Helicobacter sp. faydin-H75]MDP2538774.1 cell division protein FtsZ [Helicobacter sp. faydin-H76]